MSDVWKRLAELANPAAECMPDDKRLTAFCRLAEEIERENERLQEALKSLTAFDDVWREKERLRFNVDHCMLTIARQAAESERLRDALRPFTQATLTREGQIIGLMREDFQNAHAALGERGNG